MTSRVTLERKLKRELHRVISVVKDMRFKRPETFSQEENDLVALLPHLEQINFKDLENCFVLKIRNFSVLLSETVSLTAIATVLHKLIKVAPGVTWKIEYTNTLTIADVEPVVIENKQYQFNQIIELIKLAHDLGGHTVLYLRKTPIPIS